MKYVSYTILFILALVFSTSCFAGGPITPQPHLNGTAEVSDPGKWEAYRLFLTQIKEGFAIFANQDEPNVFVGVDASSLSVVERGVRLLQLRAISKGQVGCLKYIGYKPVEDKDGFPARLVLYTAVDCSEAK